MHKKEKLISIGASMTSITSVPLPKLTFGVILRYITHPEEPGTLSVYFVQLNSIPNQSARIVTHLNEKQFKCSLCKSYDRSNLRVHIKAVHEKITHFGFQSKWKGVDWQKVLVLCHPFQNVPKFSEISESASFRCLPKPSTAYSTTIHSSNRRKANVEVELENLK